MKVFFSILLFTLIVTTNAHAKAATDTPALSGIGTLLEIIGSFFSIKDLPQGVISEGEQILNNPANTGSQNQNDLMSSKTDFIFYCQGNTSWSNTCSLGSAGCGPTSLAMVLGSFRVTITPPQVDKIFQQNGWRSCGDVGSYMTSALHSSWLSSLGFKVGQNLAYNEILDLKQAKDYLDEGFLIIGSSRNFPCANCKSLTRIDHIFVVDNVDISNALVSIRDPNNCSYTGGDDENPVNRVKNVSDFIWLYAYPIKKI